MGSDASTTPPPSSAAQPDEVSPGTEQGLPEEAQVAPAGSTSDVDSTLRVESPVPEGEAAPVDATEWEEDAQPPFQEASCDPVGNSLGGDNSVHAGYDGYDGYESDGAETTSAAWLNVLQWLLWGKGFCGAGVVGTVPWALRMFVMLTCRQS